MKIIIYDDKEMRYIVGDCTNFDISGDFVDSVYALSDYNVRQPSRTTMKITIDESKMLDNIKLDPTTMQRIAKFNKEQEIRRLNEEIREKKDKIKELDDFLQDKEKRIDKIKKFVANIYDIDVSDYDDYDYDDYF